MSSPDTTETKNQRAPRKTPTVVTFLSTATDEPHSFYIMGLKGSRDAVTNRLFWDVPVADAETFAKHHHVTNGRVYRQGDL